MGCERYMRGLEKWEWVRMNEKNEMDYVEW